jgi:hypothetical protein
MDFEATAPLKFWMNQGRHATRRIETEARLEDAGICAERFPGVTVQPKFHKKLAVAAAEFCHIGQLKAPEEIPMRGYPSAALYVKALTQRLAIREAKKRGATAVLLLEDDWAIHPNFQTLLASLELPEDWAILHLGCVHYEKPAWVAARLVRVKQAGQSSGVIVRASHYQQVIQLLDRHGKKSVEPGSVNELVEWKENEEVPAYACYPNLLWRDAGILETHCVDGPHFTRDGKQVFHVAAVEHLLPELIEEEEETPLSIALHKQKPVKLGLLFLTRGDVHHVDIWREFVAEAPEQVAIYAHAKHPEQLVGGFLDGKVIADYHETAWGEISLVRATRSLLLKDHSFRTALRSLCAAATIARNSTPIFQGSAFAIWFSPNQRSDSTPVCTGKGGSRNSKWLLAFPIAMVGDESGGSDFCGGARFHRNLREDDGAR